MAELAGLLHVQYIVSAEVRQRRTLTGTNYETRRDDRRDRRTRRTVTRSEREEFSNKVAFKHS